MDIHSKNKDEFWISILMKSIAKWSSYIDVL
jgi:hypothetical protein